MNTYLKLKDGSIVCLYGGGGGDYMVYSLEQRNTSAQERDYDYICISEVVQSDTNITVLGGKL